MEVETLAVEEKAGPRPANRPVVEEPAEVLRQEEEGEGQAEPAEEDLPVDRAAAAACRRRLEVHRRQQGV